MVVQPISKAERLGAFIKTAAICHYAESRCFLIFYSKPMRFGDIPYIVFASPPGLPG